MPTTSTPTLADMFSGAGLFSAGMTKAGFAPVFAVDMASDAVASYRRNVAPCAVRASVEDLKDVPEVDVLIAGPPCQGFSTLGRRDPTDVRNNLSLSVLPILDMARPRIVAIENVPPFLRSRQWAALASGLEERGYVVQAFELDAVDFGAPQFRRRAFTIASSVGPVEEPVPHPVRRTAGSVLFDMSTLADDPMNIWPSHAGIAGERIRRIPALGDKRDLMRDAPELCPPSWEKVGCHATDVWGRIDPDKPANTIRCTFQNASKGRYIHPTENRVLTLREGARLQGVPDDWLFEGLPYPVARQIGNGVPVPLAAAIGMSIQNALKGVGRAYARPMATAA